MILEVVLVVVAIPAEKILEENRVEIKTLVQEERADSLARRIIPALKHRLKEKLPELKKKVS